MPNWRHNMAHVLYGVQGVGHGHALRSRPIIQRLRHRGHTVTIAASGKAQEFFNDAGETVVPLDGFNFVLGQKGELRYIKTLIATAKAFPRAGLHNSQVLSAAVKEHRPDVVVTDFEPFAALAAYRYRLPLVSIDNQHRITNCRLSVPRRMIADRLAAATVIRTFVPRAKQYIVTSMVPLKQKLGLAKLAVMPPILRSEIEQVKPQAGSAIVVYMWQKYLDLAVPLFKQFPEQQFIIYGSASIGEEGNVSLRGFDSKNIISDLANCAGVIGGGGFTFLSEALALGKPALIWPQPGQFEQMVNGLDLSRAGCAMLTEELTVDDIAAFLKQRNVYAEAAAKLHWPPQAETLDQIINLITKVI